MLRVKEKETISLSTHLLHSQAALCAWEPLYQDRPQVSLPQASTVHLRGQTADLSWRALAGFVGQLDGWEIKKQMQDQVKKEKQHTL